MWNSRNIILFLILMSAAACGAAAPTNATGISSGEQASDTVKMRHQILFQNKDDTQVFEGVMIHRKDGYIVQAFAGPGMDLFTVARSGGQHKEILHIQALSNKIDVSKIGEDIFCIYMEGCPSDSPVTGTEEISCVREGRRLTENFNPDGRLVARQFPDAHGIGLSIQYSGYNPLAGRWIPTRIALRWGDFAQSLTIQTVSAEGVEAAESEVIDHFLVR